MEHPASPTTGTRPDVAACVEQTQVTSRRAGVFRPRLQSFNHIELHRSRLVRSPLAQLGLWGLQVFDRIRDAVQRLGRALFPRRARIYGTHRDNAVIGRLTFAQRRYDNHVPIHHMHLELWGRTLWGGFRKLGAALTDWDGRFTIRHDLQYARRWWMRRISLEVYHTGNHRFVDGTPVNDYILFKRIKINQGDLVGMACSLGTIPLFYWEYDHSAQTPRVIIKDHDVDAPQKYNQGRTDAIEQQFVPIELIKVKHLAEIELGDSRLDIPRIQADYPENLTVCLEKQDPGFTRGDDWFGERMMNGMYASDFDRDPQNPDLLWVHYHWNSYDKRQDYAMPDVDIRFRLKPDGLPLPVEITLTGPLNAYELDQRPKRTFTPADGDRWMQAKRVARVSGALYTELAHHFAGTHLNTEQYAIAAYRNLRLSPLTTLLFPHLKEVILVDHTADRILVGPGYITHATALTPKGINQVARNVMGTLDWKNWEPMPPLSEAHAYAKASWLFWEVVQEYVDDYLEEYAEEIQAQWHEVCCFSNDLVHHSVPMFLCKYLQHALHDDAGRLKDAHHRAWYREAHRMDLSLARPQVNGTPKAVSPITQASRFADAPPEDWAALRQACCYMIFQASFGHTWPNSKQYDDIGEILYNCLGLRFGDGEDGVLAPESDTRIAPDLTRATQMMWWSNMLSRTGYGYIMANEDGDINPKLIAALEQRRDAFAPLGLDIDAIQSRTNI